MRHEARFGSMCRPIFALDFLMEAYFTHVFLFPFLLDIVLPVKGNAPRCNDGMFCLLPMEGSCPSSILGVSWDNFFTC